LVSWKEETMRVLKYLDLALPHISERTRDWFDEATPARTHCTGITDLLGKHHSVVVEVSLLE
jgi:hypothetical protein